MANIFFRLKMFFIRIFLWRSFIDSAKNPDVVQKKLLKKIIKKNSNTVFGKEHSFNKINSYKDFKNALPVQTYEDLRPYIEKQESTKEPYLNKDMPVMYAQTSGTTGQPKYIPILKNTISEFRRSQHIATYGGYSGVAGMYDGKVLAIVSPSVEGHMQTGTPYGSMSGLIYESMPKVVRSKYIVPPEVFDIEDYELKYYLIVVFSVLEPNITMIATANPSTIVKLSNIIKNRSGDIIKDIASGTLTGTEVLSEDVRDEIKKYFKRDFRRAGELKKILLEGGNVLSKIWPNLVAVTTWTGGNCSVVIPSIKKILSDNKKSSKVKIVEMGYLSSEFRGTITVDAMNNKGVPSIEENFFEFVEESARENKDPKYLTIGEVEEGRRYYVVVTTGGGLYRYFVNDIVKVDGMFHKTPTIIFEQKGKGVTSLTGEKLYESQLLEAVIKLKEKLDIDFSFFMMLADINNMEYTLYIESEPLRDFTSALLEDELSLLNMEFEAKRKSGRINDTKVVFVCSGTGEAYKKHCIDSGQREGQFKFINLQYLKDCQFDFMNREVSIED